MGNGDLIVSPPLQKRRRVAIHALHVVRSHYINRRSSAGPFLSAQSLFQCYIWLSYLCFPQLLRQVLDEKVLFNTKKPFDRRVLEGVVVTAAMNMQSEPVTSGSHQQIPERLKVSLCLFVIVKCTQKTSSASYTLFSLEQIRKLKC